MTGQEVTGRGVQAHLRAPTEEAVAVQVGDAPGQRQAKHLQLLPADHMTRQVLLEGRGIFDEIMNGKSKKCSCCLSISNGNNCNY